MTDFIRREFTLSYLTTAPLDVSDMLLLAHRIGYCAIGVRLAPLSPGGHFSPLSENAASLRETLACIQDTGVAVFDIEGVRLDEHFRHGSFDRQLEVAARLGAKVISVIGDDPHAERLIDSFGHICDAAAPYHLAVALEFMPYSQVADSNAALQVLRKARRFNGRIAVDLLHVSRSNMTRADLVGIPADCLSYAQLCDAPGVVPTTREGLVHTARCARLLPGAGTIDVRGMVHDLPLSLPLSVEIPNTEQLALHGAEEWARRALLATRHALRNDGSNL